MIDLRSFCVPIGQSESEKGQSAAAPFKMAIRRWN